MKSKISIVVTFVFIFVSSASFSQYKYDIGLRASTNGLERFQLDFRYHFNSPYSLLITAGSGSKGTSDYTQSPVYNDSLVNTNYVFSTTSNNVMKVGVQRKLSFLASDCFYVGATAGFGVGQQRFYSGHSVYSVETDSMGNILAPIHLFNSDEQTTVYSHQSEYTNRSMNAQLALSFGMDVPISKRFSINAEIGFGGVYTKSLDYSYSLTTLFGAASGGLRYSFGKR